MAKETRRGDPPIPPRKGAPTKPGEIVKRQPDAESSALALPDYLRPGKEGPRGGEELGPRDVVQPRLAICQAMTPHRKASSDKYIKGLEEGEYYNTAYGKRYGSSVLVVPIFFFKSQIRFKPFEEGGGVVCQAQDGKKGVGDPGGACIRCPFGPVLGWTGEGKDRQPPECTEFKNYAVIIIPKDKMPTPEDAAVLSFKTTAIKKSNEWASRLRSYNRDWWTTIHELTTIETSNDQDQSWFLPVPAVYDGPRLPASTRDERLPSYFVSKDMYEIGKTVYDGMMALRAAGRLTIDIDPDGGAPAKETSFEPGEMDDVEGSAEES